MIGRNLCKLSNITSLEKKYLNKAQGLLFGPSLYIKSVQQLWSYLQETVHRARSGIQVFYPRMPDLAHKSRKGYEEIYCALMSAVAFHVIMAMIFQVAKLTVFRLSVNKINFDNLIYEHQDTHKVFKNIKLKIGRWVKCMLCVSQF